MIDYKDLLKRTNTIRGCMQDDLSRKIYDGRVMNALTYDYKYITAITKDGVNIFNELERMLESYKGATVSLL